MAERRTKLVGAGAAAAGLAIAWAAARAARGRREQAKAVVTVNRPTDEVYRAWRELEHELRPAPADVVEERPGELIAWRSGSVRFSAAPGGRGTEVRVELLAKRARRLRLRDDLRRFKQLLEAGEIARSDALPAGEDLVEVLRQRAAQPVPEREGAAR